MSSIVWDNKDTEYDPITLYFVVTDKTINLSVEEKKGLAFNYRKLRIKEQYCYQI